MNIETLNKLLNSDNKEDVRIGASIVYSSIPRDQIDAWANTNLKIDRVWPSIYEGEEYLLYIGFGVVWQIDKKEEKDENRKV